ncbi:MAG: extracellular solute-binding protein [Haloferacaceae archaeon]
MTETDTPSGGSTGSGGSGVELRMWLSYITEGGGKKEYTNKVLGNWQEETGNSVSIRGVPYTDVVSKFRSARAAGDVPHMVEVMTRPGILAGGAGLVINDLFESSNLADSVSDVVMDGHRVWGAQSTGEQGNLVSVPLGLRPFIPAYNTNHLEKAGIDKATARGMSGGSISSLDATEGGTLETDVWQPLKSWGGGGMSNYFPDSTGMKQSDEEYLSGYIPMFGGSKAGVVSVDGSEQAIDTEAGRAAVEWQFRNVDKGYFHDNSINQGDEEVTTQHQEGTLTINHVQDSTDLWANYRSEVPQQFKNGGYTWGLPYNGGTKSFLSWLPSLGFMADANWNQARRDAAIDLLNYWVADPDRALSNAQTLGFVPVDPSAIQSVEWFGSTQQHTEFWREAAGGFIENIVPSTIPAVKGANAITYQIPRRMHQRASQAMGGGTSISDAVAEATKIAGEEIQKILDENK